MSSRRTKPATYRPQASVVPTAGYRPQAGVPTVPTQSYTTVPTQGYNTGTVPTHGYNTVPTQRHPTVPTRGYGYQTSGTPGAPAPSGYSGHMATPPPPPPPPPAGHRGQRAPTWSGHGGVGPIPTHGGQPAAPSAVPSYELQVVAYNRGTDRNTGRPLPYHWSFHVATGETRTVFHQLRGSPGRFYYQGEEKAMLLASSSYLKAVTIGAIPANQLANLEQVLQTVPIQNDYQVDPYWNCQSWCCAALPFLMQSGWIPQTITETNLRMALIERAEQ